MTYLRTCAALALLTGSLSASSQSLPADTGTTLPGVGFALPTVGGSLSYAVSLSELLSTGFYSTGLNYSTNISGDLAYVSKSPRHPFSAVYDGGVLIGNSSQPTTVFQNLSFSQVLSTKRWNFTVADSVSYLPQSPLGGLSGIPGVGDLGVDPISVGAASGLGILTQYGPRVSNTASATAGRQLSTHLSVQGTGNYSVQRFIGDNANLGLNNDSEGGSAGVSYHFSARDTLTGNYNYSHFSYSNSPYAFTTQGPSVDFSRQWSARLSTDAYVGPQIISGTNTLIDGTSVQLAGGASASYLSRGTAYSASYSRGANNGSGVIPGSFADSVLAAAHRRLGRAWDVSGNVGFSRSVSLPNVQILAFNSKAVTFGGQGTRKLGRYFTVYGSYTVQDQSSHSTLSSFGGLNAYSGVYQVVGLGISYSPRNILLGK